MLVLTEAAAEAVKSITSTSPAPAEAGLRIASNTPEPGTPAALQVSTTAVPGEDDQVVETSGARVFLEPQAAIYLEDKVLDAQVDEQGEAHFALGIQAPGKL
jgi:Fe-S cluster assembly iron-binding protein IscA